LEELQSELTVAVQRYGLHGWVPVACFIIDNPKQQERILTDTMVSLKPKEPVQSAGPSKGVDLTMELCVPVEEILVVTADSDLCGALDLLMNDLKDDPHQALGIDAEWNGNSNVGVDLLQLSSADHVVLIRLSEICKRMKRSAVTGRFPMSTSSLTALKNLLENAAIAKVGVNTKVDQTMLQKHFEVNVANFVNCATLATQRGVVTKPNMSLAQLLHVMTGLTISKDQAIRVGAWDRELTDAMRDYAAADARAGRLVYLAIVRNQDPVHDIYSVDATQEGKRVFLCDASGSVRLASGTVVANPRNSTGQKPSTFLGKYAQTVTPFRVVIEIDTVLVSSATIPIPLTRLGQARGRGKGIQPPIAEFTHTDGKIYVLANRHNLRAYRDYVPPDSRITALDTELSGT
jgi:hypothetical protein